MTPEKFESLCRVKAVIDKFDELIKAFKELNKEEYKLLITALEKSLEEKK